MSAGLTAPTPAQALEILRPYGIAEVQLGRGGTAWFGIGDEYVGYVAAGAAGVGRLALEAARLDWAGKAGIGVPPRAFEEPGLLVSHRVAADPLVGASAADAAASAAELIRKATPPPQGEARDMQSFDHRSRSYRTLPRRWLRGVIHHVSWFEFVRARGEAAELPATELSHGDFQTDNLLWDARTKQLHVVDWDYAAPAAEGTDLLTLWVHVTDDAARDRVLEAALAQARDRRAVGVLAHWLALRFVGDVVSTDPTEPSPQHWAGQLALARQSLARARQLRADLT